MRQHWPDNRLRFRLASAALALSLLPAIVGKAQVVFNNPESVVYDAVSHRYLISNVGSGDIVQVDSAGHHSYFATVLTRTLGMVIVGDTLFVTDSSGVVGFDLITGVRAITITIPGSEVLNDITADASGFLYVTDSGRGSVYRVRISDQTSSMLASGIYWPNGIHFDQQNNRILFCSFGSNAAIRAIQLADHSVSTVIETNFTDLDGLTEDNNGNIYVSSWGSGSVYRYDHNFASPPELVSGGHEGPADIFFNKLDQTLVVPNFNSNTVSFLPIMADKFTRVLEGDIVNDGGGSWGVSWIDYDTDGWLDLFVVNPNSLYHNEGDGTFTKIYDDIIVTDPLGWGGGCSWADYDNDGDPDAFVANWDNSNNLLYCNNADGSFTKDEGSLIANDPGWSISPSWVDVDNDGDLDLYVANHDTEPRTGAGRNFLYEKRGGSFTKIINSTIVAEASHSNHASWADFDNDGDLDVVVINAWGDDRSNALFRNDGNMQFIKVSASEVCADDSDSWGASWGDFDNDGDLDLLVTAAPRNLMYENDGEGHLTRIESPPITETGENSGGSAWADYDNDGDLDLFVAVEGYDFPQPNLLYENDGAGHFSRVREGSIVTDLNSSNGAAWADYDQDGDLDLFVTNALHQNENNILYRNNGNLNSWINIRLIGTTSNRSAIGAKVWVTASIGGAPVTQLREITSQSGKNGQNSLNVHFGLGDAQSIQIIRIEWPSGLVESITDVRTKQRLTITEGEMASYHSPRRPAGRRSSSAKTPKIFPVPGEER